MNLFLRCIVFLIFLLISISNVQSDYHEIIGWILIKFATNFTITMNALVFACNKNNLLPVSKHILGGSHFVEIISLNAFYIPEIILNRSSYRKTLVLLDHTCSNANIVMWQASFGRYLNKTYQWFLWSYDIKNLEMYVRPNINYFGPNSQISFINGTNLTIKIWSAYSFGRHLLSPFKVTLIDNVKIASPFKAIRHQNISNKILEAQHSRKRNKFNGLTLRGVTVVDIDNVTTNNEITTLLSNPVKHTGISAFTKYYFELIQLLKDHMNFTIDFRASRGWAGRLKNTKFRLGFLGIISRNEADIGASGAFNRINRFADFDIIYQGWKFRTAFLYRFVPELSTKISGAAFLIPFQRYVWVAMGWIVVVISLFLLLIENIEIRLKKKDDDMLPISRRRIQSDTINSGKSSHEENEPCITSIILFLLAAICQQCARLISTGNTTKILLFSVFIFSLMMYNYYTSSVVSGLLSSSLQGPSSVDEIISSSIKVAFEDIGYYKVLFRESKSPIISRLITQKLLKSREGHALPIYTNIKSAIPYIKEGSYAFHCELVDAFPEIAKQFNANEVCTLRTVEGLMSTELMNGILHKNSQYTEVFRFTSVYQQEAIMSQRHQSAASSNRNHRIFYNKAAWLIKLLLGYWNKD